MSDRPAPLHSITALAEAFCARDFGAVYTVSSEMMAEGDDDGMAMAVALVRDALGDDVADDLLGTLTSFAGTVLIDDGGLRRAMLISLPVVASGIPDHERVLEGLQDAGFLPDGSRLHHLPGWVSPEAVLEASPSLLRALVLGLVSPEGIPAGGPALRGPTSGETVLVHVMACTSPSERDLSVREMDTDRIDRAFGSWRARVVGTVPEVVAVGFPQPSSRLEQEIETLRGEASTPVPPDAAEMESTVG